MINLKTEKLISLVQAARMMPRGRRDGAVHLSTVLRWILRGVKRPDGETVKLEAIRIGCRWLTSVESLQRFGDELTPCDAHAEVPRTPGKRERAIRRAEKELERIGI
jgi:hypothetical protein